MYDKLLYQQQQKRSIISMLKLHRVITKPTNFFIYLTSYSGPGNVFMFTRDNFAVKLYKSNFDEKFCLAMLCSHHHHHHLIILIATDFIVSWSRWRPTARALGQLFLGKWYADIDLNWMAWMNLLLWDCQASGSIKAYCKFWSSSWIWSLKL